MYPALTSYINHGLYPGSMLEALLKGDRELAYIRSHVHVKEWIDKKDPDWMKFMNIVDGLPVQCRGKNFESWIEHKGLEGCSEELKLVLKLQRFG